MSGFWERFTQVAQVLAPAALTLAGVPAGVIPLVVHGITVAEDAANGHPMTGEQKKALALDVVQTGLAAVNVASGKAVFDVGEVSHVVSQGIDTAVAAVNAAQNVPVKSPKPAA
jgi:hypothetical protein